MRDEGGKEETVAAHGSAIRTTTPASAEEAGQAKNADAFRRDAGKDEGRKAEKIPAGLRKTLTRLGGKVIRPPLTPP